ncbi:MAG: NfeD family protein [Spirochaetes bacterium]|nr:NfeD family protein [Spirochaetota bacterium]MBL7005624.1 NfeD family protein [Spirochaetia bacterium]
MDLLTNPVFLWLIAAVILLILEFVIPGVLVVFFSFGAFVLMLITWILPNIPLNIQLIIFLIVSVLSLVLLRRKLKKVFHGRKSGSVKEDETDEIVGKTVTVTVDITPKSSGRISLNGTEWSAESAEECKKGERVIITGRESLKVTVKKDK